jgi:hypothetical protein
MLLLCSLAAFGGRSASAAIVFSLGSVLLAFVIRPAILGHGTSRLLDRILLAAAAAIALQATPLPLPVVHLLSPHAAIVSQELALIPSMATWRSLSIDNSSTRWAGVVVVGAITLFFTARTIVSSGGLRQTVRGISALGLAFSALAIAQAATAGRSIYWRFPTENEGPLPFGPFVNRNHFATWVVMTIPLCFGYMMARASAPERANAEFVSTRARLARMADGRMAWLAAAGAMMLAALLVSLSRSGILALTGALSIFAGLHARHLTVRRAWWTIGALVLFTGAALTRADLPALAERFSQSGAGIRDRVRIWSDTLPIVKDFWATGTGSGTYRIAMLYYQRADRNVQFNQAHNHYLQVAAEGGIVLVSLLVATITTLGRAVRRQLEAEASGAYWIRAGAACGLLAAALQSLWETGLVMPANAAMAAVLAAIASYER